MNQNYPEKDYMHKINFYSRLKPFFMTLSSPANHWLFISSTGGITAGRCSPENAIFPYETVDKIHENWRYTGPKTIIFAKFANRRRFLWQPFNLDLPEEKYVERNLYKSIINDEIVFEEINKKLKLVFRYSWRFSDRFGFVRFSEIRNIGKATVYIEILDGVANILPANTNRRLQNESSCLLDAYKKSELLKEINLAIYYYSSIPSDRPQPMESLKATTAWSLGIKNPIILLSNRQVSNFLNGKKIGSELDIRGEKGAYFLCSKFALYSDDFKKWNIVLDIGRDIRNVSEIKKLHQKDNLQVALQKDLESTRAQLTKILFDSDGFQFTSDKHSSQHHLSNVLFNIMRGGYIYNPTMISIRDFLKFVYDHNRIAYEKLLRTSDNNKDNKISYSDFEEFIKKINDQNLCRLFIEYLPLTFSRRHGDPSRPWNSFSISVSDEKGEKILSYQGNWRDLFQNWDALAISYPRFIFSFIAKFLNCTSAEGYNPYRIMREGFEWEEPEPDNPWAHIGYWGDHQIIYLLRLLEFAYNTYPETFIHLFQQKIFVYANIPYRIKSYKEICSNPRETIIFDKKLSLELKDKVKVLGNDGKLLCAPDGKIIHVSMIEKILVPLLTKLANFVPEGGIWLNTQRPEWNDANNALAGYGLSMVTVYYIHRYLLFFKMVLEKVAVDSFELSDEIYRFFEKIFNILISNSELINKEIRISDEERKKVMDLLGESACEFRKNLYQNSLSGKQSLVSRKDLIKFTEIALQWIAYTIKKNERPDGLFHSYNILLFDKEMKKAGIKHLYEMLEGQVAVLSSNYLTTENAIRLLLALKKSKMFRKDQYSYMLYPDRKLKTFVERGLVPKKAVKKYSFLKRLSLKADNGILIQDAFGQIYFDPNIKNEEDLKEVLEKTNGIREEEKDIIRELYEEVFRHSEFTGRSGTFFAYEGLGCIYWHMVSKLLLAVQENYFNAISENRPKSEIEKLHSAYYDVRKGLGFNKTPEEYGAFPTDPYSHTPKHSGASQPGMTGQVKEEIITRFGELGVRYFDGKITFDPRLLRKDEFFKEQSVLVPFIQDCKYKRIKLNKFSLLFTLCGIPVIYELSIDIQGVKVFYKSGQTIEIEGNTLDIQVSKEIFERNTNIEKIIVSIIIYTVIP